MERFAIKIDKKLKANLYKICRLCGIDNPDMVPIISDKPEDNESACIDVEAELEMQQKINILLGLSITKDDRMPQTMCCLCVDKINDFYEFREMCYATNAQTRKLLGLKNIKKPALDIKPKIEIKEESIVPTPIPISAPGSASALHKNNKKRKSEELALKDEKLDVTPVQQKKKLRFSASAESNIKEEASLQTKKKSRFSATNEELAYPVSCSSKKSKNNAMEDTKLKKESSPPVPAPVISLAISNKKLRLAAPPQKELAIKKSKQKPGKNIEAEVKEEIKEEVTDEPTAIAPHLAKALPVQVKGPPPPKLKFGCNICKERFPAKVNLETHRATHIPKVERYVCTACNEILSKSFDIKNHQLWHKLSKTPYVCGCCGESILNTYAFSRHLREHAFDTPPALLVLDRECPQCHTSYATNFLYNIHICAVKTRRCAGCNRIQRNDAEYLKHSAQCAKVYLNYSKHIMPSVEALEDAVRIKNENDVEAAAEEMARISGVSLDMAPVVQLTRLSSPLIMAASHAVSTTGLDDTANTSNKKSGKKGVSKKDLRRVDELLKSTLDALVSIKHEPEVHVDQETPCAAEQSDNDDHETDDHVGGLDDFHHNNDTDSENEETSNYANVANTIKSSIAAEEGVVKIKQEIDETTEGNANKVCGGLKLKIKKEHGQLNSSIIEQQQSSEKRAEKRKKKKKHKEREKDKQKLSKDNQDEPDTNINNNSGEENIGTTTIRIKVEPQEGSDFGDKSVLQQRPQPEATIMTSIPMMQFQIACVSSGVEFNNATNPVTESDQTLSSAIHDAEAEDVKPNREELDRMLKISHISSGIAMETNETQANVATEMAHVGSYEKGGEDKDDYHEQPNDDDQHALKNKSDYEGDNQSENPGGEPKESVNEMESNERHSVEDTEDNEVTVASKAKSKLQSKLKLTTKLKDNQLSVVPKSRNRACKSTAKPPNISTLQISSVQSGVTLEPTTSTTSEFSPIFIKPEPQNRGYSDEQPTVTSPMRHPEEIEATENLAHAPHTEEEQNYISTIDFNNIVIKQEKDIEINDVQITEKSIKSIAKLNGIKRKRKQVKDKNLEQNEGLENNGEYVEDEENQSNIDDEDTDSEGMEEEEDEAEEEEDEEDEEMEEEEEQEEREYRELEYPPELSADNRDHEEEDDLRPANEIDKDLLNKENGSGIYENPKEKENKVSFIIANVCTQAITDNYEENLTKLREEGVTNNKILECKEANILPRSNLTATSEQNVDTIISSGERVLSDINIAETNLNADVPNVSVLQKGLGDEVEKNVSQNENITPAIVLKPPQTKETYSPVQFTLLSSETNSEQLLNPEAQSQQFVDHVLQDIQAVMPPQEPEKPGKNIRLNAETNRARNHQEKLLCSASDAYELKDQHNLQDALEHTQESKSISHGLLENLSYIKNSDGHSPHQSLPTAPHSVLEKSPVKTAAFNNTAYEVGPCLPSNNNKCQVAKDNQEEIGTATIEGFVHQSKDGNLEAQPVIANFDSESVGNDENEGDCNEGEEDNEEESTLANNLEERQNCQNQEVLSQIRPTALALHPYLEDISSSSNSLLSNSLSQTPPPPLQLASSATGVNNNFNSQRLLNTEETENILNESNEVAETLAMSVSQPLTQHILGQPLPPQMPTFNFDNINEIAENNNNANIEREQLQDEHHQQQN